MSRVTLVSVNYRNTEATERLKRSLEQQTDTDFDLIVVDNSEHNRGFAGGCNVGIRQALERGAQWVLLINNDTIVEPDFIATLPLHTPGFIGLPLREGRRVAFAGIVRWLRATLPHAYAPLQSDRSYVIGAGMLIHRNVFDRIGFLDERYFLYFEDADFSMRARRARVPISFVRTPIITHAVSESTRHLGSPLLLRYHMRNALLFNRLHAPAWAQIVLPFWSFFGIIKQCGKWILMPSQRAAAAAITAGILDYYANRFGPIASDHDRH